MSDVSTGTPADPPVNLVSDLSAGVVPARIITGAKRLQVLVAGQWWDVDGVALAEVYSTNPRYAGQVTFTKITAIAPAAAGGSVTHDGLSRIAPTRSSSPGTFSQLKAPPVASNVGTAGVSAASTLSTGAPTPAAAPAAVPAEAEAAPAAHAP